MTGPAGPSPAPSPAPPPDPAAGIRQLLRDQPLGALGTLQVREGQPPEPVVTMVPLLWLPGAAEAHVHISQLAPHTRQLQHHPLASLLLMAPRRDGDDPLALPRLTLQVRASPVPEEDALQPALRAAHAARFASAALTLGLGDFAFWCLSPQSARYVAGFGRAHALTAEALAAALQAGP